MLTKINMSNVISWYLVNGSSEWQMFPKSQI